MLNKSHMMGKIDLDYSALEKELYKLNTDSKVEEEYDEYSSGYWENITLWNHNGDGNNTEYRNFDGAGVATEKSRSYPHIISLIKNNFNIEKLKMARIRMLRDAVLIPHKDYVELDKELTYLRIFIPLNDAKHSFHCDEDFVFKMRPGEVWYLSAGNVHNAVNFSDEKRISLCLDFALDGKDRDIASIFSGSQIVNNKTDAEEVDRMEVKSDKFNDLINGLSAVINEYNFKDVVFMLSKISFMYKISLNNFYDILLDVCHGSNNKDLILKAQNLKRYMIEKRGFKERLSLN